MTNELRTQMVETLKRITPGVWGVEESWYDGPIYGVTNSNGEMFIGIGSREPNPEQDRVDAAFIAQAPVWLQLLLEENAALTTQRYSLLSQIMTLASEDTLNVDADHNAFIVQERIRSLKQRLANRDNAPSILR